MIVNALTELENKLEEQVFILIAIKKRKRGILDTKASVKKSRVGSK